MANPIEKATNIHSQEYSLNAVADAFDHLSKIYSKAGKHREAVEIAAKAEARRNKVNFIYPLF